jgi:hypothetical protein
MSNRYGYLLASGSEMFHLAPASKQVQESTGNGAELQTEQTQALIKSKSNAVILFCINQS